MRCRDSGIASSYARASREALCYPRRFAAWGNDLSVYDVSGNARGGEGTHSNAMNSFSPLYPIILVGFHRGTLRFAARAFALQLNSLSINCFSRAEKDGTRVIECISYVHRYSLARICKNGKDVAIRMITAKRSLRRDAAKAASGAPTIESVNTHRSKHLCKIRSYPLKVFAELFSKSAPSSP